MSYAAYRTAAASVAEAEAAAQDSAQRIETLQTKYEELLDRMYSLLVANNPELAGDRKRLGEQQMRAAADGLRAARNGAAGAWGLYASGGGDGG